MTPIYDFTWKGESAHDVYGVETMKISSRTIAERRDETHVIAGRSGLVHIQDGAVEEVEQRLQLYLPYAQLGTSTRPFGQIRRWLKGYGRLELSNEPERYRMAYITDLIGLDPLVQGFDDIEGSVIFRCDPYLYHTDAPDIVLTEARMIENPGDAPAAPLITINATGDVDLMIGGQTVLLTGIAGQIVLDCAAEEAYARNADGTLTNLSGCMSGDFPLLPTGSFAVNWSLGDDTALSNIVIAPGWRDED